MKARVLTRGMLVVSIVVPVLIMLGSLDAAAQVRGDRDALERIGSWPYGPALALAVDSPRQRVYLGSGGAVLIVDTQDVTHPTLLSEDIRTLGLVNDIAYDPATQTLYLACGVGGLEIWDVQDAQAPERLKILHIYDFGFETPVEHVVHSDHFVILGCDWGPGVVVDVSDPVNPVILSSTHQVNDLHISDNGLLHLVGYDGYFRYRVLPDGGLQGLGGFVEGQGDHPYFVVGADSRAAFVKRNSYVYIIKIPDDIFDPLYGVLSGYANLLDIDLSGDYAYFAIGAYGELRILDTSNLYAVHQVGAIFLEGGPRVVQVVGQYAYVASGSGGLRIVDVADPTQPVEVGSFETLDQSVRVALKGDYALVTNQSEGVLVIDEQDMSEPNLAAQLDTPGYATGLDLDGDLLYIADYDGGLRIADVTDPVLLFEVGNLAIDYTRLVDVAGGYAYLIAGPPNEPIFLYVVDVSDPGNPETISTTPMPERVSEIEVEGNFLYAAAEDDGLRVLDISDPMNPIEVGSLAALETRDIAVSGSHACLATRDGVLVLDVSDPTDPTVLGQYDPFDLRFPFDVELIGNMAYATYPVADELAVLYIGDPTNPAELGRYAPPGDMSDLLAQDSLLFIADGSAGLLALENTLYPVPPGDIRWEPVESGTDEDLRGIHFADLSNGCVVGDEGTILKTTDGGDSWSPQSSGTTEDLFAVFLVDELTGWVGGRNGVILKTTNGGLSWSPQSSGTTNLVWSMSFTDELTGWAVGSNGTIRKTTNGGNSWFGQSGGGSDFLASVSSVSASNAWIAVSYVPGQILRTTNGGSTWERVYAPTSADLDAVCFADSDYGWAAGTDLNQHPYLDAVLRSTDGGVTWTESYAEYNGTYSSLNDISAIGHADAWVVGGIEVAGQSFQTNDAGASWLPIYGGSYEYLQSVHFVDSLHGWAAGHLGTILKAVPGYVSSVPGPGGTESASWSVEEIAGQPNPFGSSTMIAYDAPHGGPATLKIYSVLGRELRTLTDLNEGAGRRSFQWDGTDDSGVAVGTGVYLYVLRSREGVRRGKITRIR